MRVAIAHWSVRSWGGAEYLITKVAECLGVKRIYTLRKFPDSDNPFGNVEFVELYGDLSPLNRIMLKAMGRAWEYFIWESMNLREYEDFEILLTSGSTARAIITPEDIVHVNYCHSPPRWLYDLYHERIKRAKLRFLYNIILSRLRVLDVAVDRRVDYYLVNSPIIKRRLWKYLKRDSKILYPPIELRRYKFKEFGDFYLYLGRLDYEKGVVEIVKAFKELGEKLILAGGKGTAYSEVIKLIENSKNIEYVGFVSEDEKLKLLSECKAVVFNAINEDFGIVPIEANASGKPCICVKSGFPGLFIKDGVNGILHDGSVEGIEKAVERFESMDFNPDKIRSFAEKFDVSVFERRLKGYLQEFYEDFNSKLEEDY